MVSEISINKMPAPTWRWLKLNDRRIAVSDQGEAGNVNEFISSELAVSEAVPAGIECGSGAAVEELLQGTSVKAYTVPAGVNAGTTRIDFNIEDGQTVFANYAFTAEEGSDSVVVMDVRSEESAEGTLVLQTKVDVKDGAHMTLVQLHRAGDKVSIINSVGGAAGNRSSVDVLHVIFSGRDNSIGCAVALNGDKSSVNVENAYFADKDHKVDLNYYVSQHGLETVSSLKYNGVLRDSAFKTLRTTIDFKKGAKGAKGLEDESVLLLDDGVVNQTVPTLLCGEEDVEGDHGCSIGRLDESLMFYLKTRGFDEDTIYEMMSQAGLEAVFTKIPDEDIVAELLNYTDKRDER